MSGGTIFAMALPPSLDPLNPLNPYKGFYGCGGGAAYAPPAPAAPARAVPPSFALPRIITRTVKTPGTEQQQHNNDDDDTEVEAEVETGTEPTDAGGRGKSTGGRGGGGARGQKSGGGSARGGGGNKSGGWVGRSMHRSSRAQGGGGNDDGGDDGDDGWKRGGHGAESITIIPPPWAEEDSDSDEEEEEEEEEAEEEEEEEEQGPPAKKAKKGKGRAVTFAADVIQADNKNNRPGGRYFGAIKHAKWTVDNHPPPPSRRPGMPPPVPVKDRVAPWGETWAADQMPSFDFGETIFAGAYQSAQITADLLGGPTGKTPKMQPPESLPWKTRFELPEPKDMPAMAKRDAEFEKAGVWKLTKENVPALFEKKGATLMSIFPQHSDCNSNKKFTVSLV